MNNEKGSKFSIGYKKPPRHTQFKTGQSGNPSGRPRKTYTFPESFEKDLNTRITVSEGGKQRRITKHEAIVKQQTNKAVHGDPKATALVMKVVEPRESEQKGALFPFMDLMRARHAELEASEPEETSINDHSDRTNDED